MMMVACHDMMACDDMVTCHDIVTGHDMVTCHDMCQPRRERVSGLENSRQDGGKFSYGK